MVPKRQDGTPDSPEQYWGSQQGTPSQGYPTQPEPPYGQTPAAPQSAQQLQQAVQLDAQQQLPEKRHVHHSYIWLTSITAALSTFVTILIVVMATMLGERVEGNLSSDTNISVLVGVIVVGAFVVVMALVAGIQVLTYKNLYYELGPEEFNLYSGIISKKKVHIPYQRIQSVNQRATLVQRLAGVCTLTIDTAGGSSNKAVIVPYVQNVEAERLRREIFARKQAILANGKAAGATGSVSPRPGSPTGSQVATQNVLDMPASVMKDVRGVFGGDVVDTGEVTYEYGMSNRELIFTGLSNSMGFVFVVLAVIGSIVTAVSQVLTTAVGRALANEGLEWATRMFAENLVGFIVAVVLVVMFFTWVVSVIGTCISYGGFHARRRQSRIEVEHGLLQHQFHGVDIDRVQSVIVKQGVIRRLLGYCELSLGKIDALSDAEASDAQKAANQAKGLVIHPFVKMNRVPEILAGLIPEFADVPTETIKLPKVSLRRALIRRCIWNGGGFWLAVLVVILQATANFIMGSDGVLDEATAVVGFSPEAALVNTACIVLYVVCALIFVLEAIGAVLWFRGSSFAYNQKFMQVTNGGFARESVSFPRKKIQFGTVRTNPFQRLSGVATVIARTAAGIGGTSLRLQDVAKAEAATWLDWLQPHHNTSKKHAPK